MISRMNYRNIFDTWIGFVSGVFGGGLGYTLQISWHDEWLKLAIAACTALIAGGLGVVGKYLAVWGWNKIKSFITKNKK